VIGLKAIAEVACALATCESHQACRLDAPNPFGGRSARCFMAQEIFSWDFKTNGLLLITIRWLNQRSGQSLRTHRVKLRADIRTDTEFRW